MNANDIERQVAELLSELVALRHELHGHPEIRLEEHWTSERISQYLSAAGIEHTRGHAKGTGIVATVRGQAGPTMVLRADMDALEIQEETGAPYASTIPNRMHACGHDGHCACLCGAAKILAANADKLRGTVKCIFQPGEEVEAAGCYIVEEGLIDGAAAAFALHAWPGFPVGCVGTRSGPMLASADFFHIEVTGKGGHAAYPSAAVDPIIVAAHITTALQTIVSREVAPEDPAVVTVAAIHAGTGANIIPETAYLEGTFRALTPDVRDTIAAAIRRIAEHTAQAFRATANVRIPEQGYPALSNDPGMTEFARATVIDVLGPDAFVEIEHPSMGAEDFAFYLERVPGALLCLGNASDAEAASPPLHNPHFDFNDDAIPVGVRILVELAARFLNTKQGG